MPLPALTITVKQKRDLGIGINSQDRGIALTRSASFIVVTNRKAEPSEEINVLTASGLPIVNYSLDEFGAKCISKKLRRDKDSMLVWHVDCEFSTGKISQEKDPDNTTDPENPLTWFPIWTGSNEIIEIPSNIDASGRPVLNSAGYPFDTPFMLSFAVPVSKFTQFEDKDLTLKEIKARSNTVNIANFTSTRFGTFPKYTLLLIVDSYEYLQNNFFEECWKIDYTVKYLDFPVAATGVVARYRDPSGTWSSLSTADNIGWREPVIDHGWQQTGRVPCTDVQGRPIDGLLASGAQIYVETGGTPNVLLYDRFKPISFEFLRKRT